MRNSKNKRAQEIQIPEDMPKSKTKIRKSKPKDDVPPKF